MPSLSRLINANFNGFLEYACAKKNKYKKPVCFVHIPKTAGTSFRVAAYKYYGKRAIVCDYGENAPETSDSIKHYIYHQDDFGGMFHHIDNNNISMVCGHFPARKYIAGLGVSNTVVLLRDPMQRVYSEYQHLIRKNKYDKTFLEFFSQKNNVNVLYRKLLEVPIESIGLCGITSQYGDFLNIFNHTFGANIKLLKENRRPENSLTENNISPDDVKLFTDINGKDIKFYEYAKNIFKQRLSIYNNNQIYAHAKLNLVASDRIAGWAWWEIDSYVPVVVTVRVNGHIVGKVSANEFAPNILKILPPRHGYVGFSYPINARRGDFVDCVIEETGQVFPPSPLTVM